MVFLKPFFLSVCRVRASVLCVEGKQLTDIIKTSLVFLLDHPLYLMLEALGEKLKHLTRILNDQW